MWVYWLGVVWGFVVTITVVILSVANVGYVAFFDTPFNAFAIESLKYDNHAIAESVWGAGSVWGYMLASALLMLVAVKLLSQITTRINQHTFQIGFGRVGLLVIVMVSLIVVTALGRGSLGSFPLSHKHLVVSGSPSFNNAVPNGVLSVYYAVLEYADSRVLAAASDEQGRALYEQFFGFKPTGKALWPQLFSQTHQSDFLATKPPNVVLHLVESLGAEPLTPAFNEGVDLVGALGPHLAQDYWFKNFLPAHNDTQSTLVRLLGNINYPTVTQSKFRNTSLATAAANVFKQQGYRTLFIYTGYEGIRNRSDYFLKQGFDQFVGAHQLTSYFGDMPTNVWGGEDAYMYEYASDVLDEQTHNQQPLFIVTLSTTNHPPYAVPSSYQEQVVSGVNTLSGNIGNLPTESLTTYKYTNDHLGHFVTRVKKSGLASNTIVAITGDHAVRGLRSYQGSALRNVAVPLYMYVPDAYKPVEPVALNQLASHKDIMPTLYHLALSEATYPNLGRNIFNTLENSEHRFSESARYLAVEAGVVLKDRPTMVYPFVSDRRLVLGEPMLLIDHDEAVRQKFLAAMAYDDLVDWMMRYQLVGGN